MTDFPNIPPKPPTPSTSAQERTQKTPPSSKTEEINAGSIAASQASTAQASALHAQLNRTIGPKKADITMKILVNDSQKGKAITEESIRGAMETSMSVPTDDLPDSETPPEEEQPAPAPQPKQRKSHTDTLPTGNPWEFLTVIAQGNREVAKIQEMIADENLIDALQTQMSDYKQILEEKIHSETLQDQQKEHQGDHLPLHQDPRKKDV